MLVLQDMRIPNVHLLVVFVFTTLPLAQTLARQWILVSVRNVFVFQHSLKQLLAWAVHPSIGKNAPVNNKQHLGIVEFISPIKHTPKCWRNSALMDNVGPCLGFVSIAIFYLH